MTGVVTIAHKSLRFKSLNGTATVKDKRVAYLQAHDFFVP